MYKDIRIPIKRSSQKIIILGNVFENIAQYMQIHNNPESGGLLFAEFKLPEIIIKKISISNKNDYRTRYEYKPDQIKQQKIIDSYFKKGLHYIGEWHTHPEKIPVPSIIDIITMKDIFIKSKHRLNYFLLIIVGNKMSENMFWIGMQNATKTIDLLKDNNLSHNIRSF
jgi:integrative and conjugative element protein (TIGR02256 family)